uniref:Uncharacterized protein LOC100185218 n=1 Tax=Phallusia mammillata TaxID=59560 RepID=A0A6F9DHM8_9ASCI|nr:uncharacterized protein LOC100185218 [Phallusia mammillata]
MGEFITLHRGHLILAKCRVTEKHNTTLLVSVFRYSSYSKAFDSINTISISLKGKWSIVGLKNVECKRLKVICPCAALFCPKLASVKVLTIENLEKCVEELQHTVSLGSEVNINRSKGLHWFIVHGPKLVCVDHDSSTLVIIHPYSNAKQVINLSALKLLSRPFPVNNFNGETEDALTFIGVSSQKPNLKMAGMQYVFEETEKHMSGNLFGCNWVWFDIRFMNAEDGDKNDHQVSLQNRHDKCDIPAAYCSVTTAIYQWQENQVMTILATQYPQLVVISCGDVVKCCDLPTSFACDDILMTNDVECRVILAIDNTNKSCCAISYSTFQIIRTWQNVTSVCKGAMLLYEDIFESIFLLHSSVDTDMIQPEQFSIICGIEDVEINQTPVDEQQDLDEDIKEHHSDEMEDLFMASPQQQEEENEKNNSAGLKKATDCLEAIQKKLWTEINDQKMLLKKKNRVVARSTTALQRMNNHIDLSNTSNSSNQDEPEELVDLFTGEPVTVQEDMEPEKCLKILGHWQNIVSDQWIVGFRLKNCSNKKFQNFAVMLSHNQETILKPPADQQLRTNMYKVQNLTKCADVSDTDSKSSKTKLATSRDNDMLPHVCLPDDEVLITTIGKLPLFGALQSKITFSATVFSHEVTGIINQDFVFDLGKVSISASEVARGLLLLRHEDLLSSSTSEKFTESVATLNSYSSTKSNLVAMSDANDVLSIIEILLQQLGFKLIAELGAYVCMEMGSLQYVIVKLQAITRRNVKLTVHSRSELECNLLLGFFKEQVPHDFSVTQVYKDSQQKHSTDLLPVASLNLADEPSLPSKRPRSFLNESSNFLPKDTALKAVQNQLLANEQIINVLQT